MSNHTRVVRPQNPGLVVRWEQKRNDLMADLLRLDPPKKLCALSLTLGLRVQQRLLLSWKKEDAA